MPFIEACIIISSFHVGYISPFHPTVPHSSKMPSEPTSSGASCKLHIKPVLLLTHMEHIYGILSIEKNYFKFPMDMLSQSFSAVTTVIGFCDHDLTCTLPPASQQNYISVTSNVVTRPHAGSFWMITAHDFRTVLALDKLSLINI